MNELSAAALGLAILAAIVGVWLRSVAHKRDTPALQRASSHSFWCALIAFFATSNASLAEHAEDSGTYSATSDVLSALTPAIMLLVIYLIGLYTWPRALTSVRSASLAPRTLATPIPKVLSTLMVLVFVAAASCLWLIRDVTSVAGKAAVQYADSDGNSWENPGTAGLRGAEQMLPLYVLALGSIAVAVVVTTLVIVFRRPLASLTPKQNQILRSVWINRLYRTSIMMILAVGANALALKSSWLWALNPDALGSPAGLWQSVPNLVVLPLALVIFFWRPPVLAKAGFGTEPTGPVVRMRDHLLSLGFLTTATTLIGGFILAGALATEEDLGYGEGDYSASTLLLVTAAALFYLLINTGFLGYLNYRSRAARGLKRHYTPLPLWSYVTASVLVLVSIYFLLAPPTDPWSPTQIFNPWLSLGLVGLLVGGFVGYRWLIGQLTVPWDVTSEQEAWYRRVLEFRALRVVSAAIVLLPAWGYQLGVLGVAIGIIVFCCPAVIVLERPTVKARQVA